MFAFDFDDHPYQFLLLGISQLKLHRFTLLDAIQQHGYPSIAFNRASFSMPSFLLTCGALPGWGMPE